MTKLNNIVLLARSIAQAPEMSDYIDGDGFWLSGNHGRFAEAFGLEARGYVDLLRAASGAIIGVRPTAKALAFEARFDARLDAKWDREDA